MDQLGDLVISGMGTMTGGKFNSITISGMGKIIGDVEAARIHISGSGTIKGNILTDTVTVSGNGTLQGDVETKYINSSGNVKCSGQLRSDTVSCTGRLRSNGKIKANTVDSQGYLSAGADVEAEEFISDGSFVVAGLLNANTVGIGIDGFCMAKEIGGENISVALKKQSHGFSPLVLPFYSLFTGKNVEHDKLKTEIIEGTQVSIENTIAKTVRGSSIKIGPGCRIDKVEYMESFEADPSSTVREIVKLQYGGS
jgi:cytoskeletal protein CcmA (bactofilin family)